MVRLPLLRTLLLASAVCVAALAASNPAWSQVLISVPASSVGCLQPITTGVWYQSFSGGPRWYYVSIFAPDGRRVFHRHGLATTTWRDFSWRPIADKRIPRGLSRYRVVYRIPGSSATFRVRVVCGK